MQPVPHFGCSSLVFLGLFLQRFVLWKIKASPLQRDLRGSEEERQLDHWLTWKSFPVAYTWMFLFLIAGLGESVFSQARLSATPRGDSQWWPRESHSGPRSGQPRNSTEFISLLCKICRVKDEPSLQQLVNVLPGGDWQLPPLTHIARFQRISCPSSLGIRYPGSWLLLT